MQFYDITMPISKNIMVYKNKEDKRPVFESIKGSTQETKMTINLHTGTHIDFPIHVFADGKTSSGFSLDSLITNVKVLDLTNIIDEITSKDLENFNINQADFILLKTTNSFKKEFDFNFVFLSISGAKYLTSKCVKGVGIDALGIERNQADHITHKELFNNNVIIMEGVNLSNVPSGEYKMIAMPMKIENVDALPVSAILIKNFPIENQVK